MAYIYVRIGILIKLTTLESTSQIFLRASSKGAFVYNRQIETIKQYNTTNHHV